MDLQLPKRKKRGGMNWETVINIYTLPRYKIMRTYCIAQGHDGRRGEIAFRIKPHTHQMLRWFKHTLSTVGPRDPIKTETELCLGAS